MVEGEAEPKGTGETESTGSVGHPDTCGPACKYFWKQKGCKDGAACTRCHKCAWKRPTVEKREAAEAAAPGGQNSDDDSYSEDGHEKAAPQDSGKGSGKAPTNHSPSALLKYEKLAANWAKYKDSTDEELEKILPRKKADGGPTSIGAMLHAADDCSQCVFSARPEGCTNKLRCKFCHEDHAPKPRNREKKKKAKPSGGHQDGGSDAKRPRRDSANYEDELDEKGNSKPEWLRGDSSHRHRGPPAAGQPPSGYAPHPAYALPPAYYGYPPPAAYGYPPPGYPPG